MEVRELGHLVLYVRNLERSARFIREVLGWRSLQDPDEVLPFPAVAFSAPSGGARITSCCSSKWERTRRRCPRAVVSGSTTSA